ncbi:DUF2515 domain-containing protein [Peribacillus saganii]|uniref:DUF2515 domain-containing protein n=1 Tax=Peribacillus saganii TaxID=2303992 RepID=A0A372LN94_9BACI|nr:DUF2515 family protein [Peribacillus saganii]RFU68459.1 DUF2515 domain-containing protein [Peribacillus saganii]
MNHMSFPLSDNEKQIIDNINRLTKRGNLDNISRTKAYAQFFDQHPSIKWAFLASMVSRNAGYNMCDLEGKWLKKGLPRPYRYTLFLTYERANWLIFEDAFPQLLLYHYSTELGTPMFHLCKYFSISYFMEKAWSYFWNERDEQRLVYSLIINEQNIIQEPVINQLFYRKHVFHSAVYLLQDLLHFSIVLFPTLNGELYGASVSKFSKLESRIELGKKLSAILFSPELFPQFLKFSSTIEHTGSRFDYEQFFKRKKSRNTPFLRTTFPVISHHRRNFQQWESKVKVKRKWFREPAVPQKIYINDWFAKKQKQMHLGITIENIFTGRCCDKE